MQNGDDHLLLARTALGDRDAFEVFVRRWDGPTDRFLCRVLPRDLACEARNATFLRVFTKAGSFAGGSAKAWLFRIAWRCACNVRRAQGRIANAIEDCEQPIFDAGPSPDAAASLDEERGAVRASMGKLATTDRALLWLCVVESMPIEQAARILQIPPSTLRYRFARALERVRLDLLKSRAAVL